ncbi:MAG TPA: NAD(P)H-hydrate dehydratase [Myxococcota bacterium]|nr:NAD(P)H-hydrate dehydratase [Myxococcota bacterium]HQK51870.1 NAD(P)H-hydrate dehydratase [Myxococcota bacterium]
MRLLDARTTRELDREAIQDRGIPGPVLMERAGTAVAQAVREVARPGRPVLILCGPGNNGGDGLVAARMLATWGIPVRVALLARKDDLRGDARLQVPPLEGLPVDLEECPDGIPESFWDHEAGAVVDALFGTGLTRPLEGPFRDAVERASALPCPRIAVDIPSGVDSDHGRVPGPAFQADLTITFETLKVGHFAWPGRARCGTVRIVPIGLPEDLVARAPGVLLVCAADASRAFPPRDPGAFKNQYGHLLVVGGLRGKVGAVLLAGQAALRAGAGLATLAVETRAADVLEGRVPDLMVEVAWKEAGDWIEPAMPDLQGFVQRYSAAVVGPGLGTRPGTASLLRDLLATRLPLVLDADALNVLATDPDLRPAMHCVATPHPGEAGRLLGLPTAAVQEDRMSAADALTRRLECVVVLKGASTVVASRDGRRAIVPTGGPGLAVAGTGDVLSGVLGALLARGMDPFDAACAGAWIHGRAGDLATEMRTEWGVLASDVLDRIPAAIAAARAESPREKAP